MKGRRATNLKVVADNTPRMSDNGVLPPLPSYLPQEIREEWDTAVKSLNDRGVLSDDVLPSVEAYVIAIWDQRDAMRKIIEDGRTFKSKGEIKKNPAVSDMKIARNEFIRLAVELGMTPAEKVRTGQTAPRGDDEGDAPDDGAPPDLAI